MFKCPDNAGQDRVAFAEAIVRSILRRTHLSRAHLITLDNWFGPRWLRFSGKLMGALGVRREPLTLPPFRPSRVLEEQVLVREGESDVFRVTELTTPLHVEVTSERALQRKVALIAPDALLFWYGASSQPGGRAAMMAYVPTPEGHWCWYAELREGEDGTTSVGRTLCTTFAEIEKMRAESGVEVID